ncbi:MAG: AraC family transcriptional regulator, partial [Bacteroidota bacterium]
IFEKVDFNEGGSIKVINYQSSQFDAPWHFHPEIELTYIVESTGIRYVGNNISDFGAGDLILLGPHLPHCWINENYSERNARSIVLQWNAGLFPTIPEYKSIQALLGKAKRGLKFDDFKNKEVIELMHNIIDQVPLERFITLTQILAKLAQDEDCIKLAGSSYVYDHSSNTSNRISKIHQFVRINYQKKIKLKEVASTLNMTEQSFSRFFSKTMNRPFFVFLNEYRVNIASRLLIETDLQVSEIGYKCGYESLPFFYQQFKKFKEYSPKQFRKMYQRIS